MDVAAAAARLARFAPPTPLVRALLLSRDLGCDLWVKNETVSPIASFKWRGALNDLLREPATRGVVTSSTGNHGQGVAWAAGVAGVPAHIFLPLGANPTKRAKIALLGATIHDGGHDLDAAKETAIAFARDEGLRFIDDGESEGVIEGAGTIGLEIARELEQIDVVYVPMGSGSLASGVAMAIRESHPQAHIVAVQSSGSPANGDSNRCDKTTWNTSPATMYSLARFTARSNSSREKLLCGSGCSPSSTIGTSRRSTGCVSCCLIDARLSQARA